MVLNPQSHLCTCGTYILPFACVRHGVIFHTRPCKSIDLVLPKMIKDNVSMVSPGVMILENETLSVEECKWQHVWHDDVVMVVDTSDPPHWTR